MFLKSVKVYTAAVLAMVFWGLTFVWFKVANESYRPITIIFLRLVVSGTGLYLIQCIFKNRETIRKDDRKWFLFLAFAQPLCYFLGESFGLTRVSPTLAAIIIATIPVITPFLAYFFQKEQITFSRILGIILSFAGIILVVYNKDLFQNKQLIGILLLFFAVFSAIAYSIIIKRLTVHYSSLTIIRVQSVIGAVYFLPLFLIFDCKHFLSVNPNSELLLSLLQLIVFGSVLAYVFYIYCIKELGVIKAGVLTNLIPIATAIASYFILDEKFPLVKIIGIFVVLLGVFISQSNITLKKRQAG